jgi:two-component system NtrC family sensor kinase
MQDLQATQSRLLQSEKMASIGQLAAGVAHEINNPVGFVKSNLHAIDGYCSDLMRLLSTYETLADYLATSKSDDETLRQCLSQSEAIKDEIDLSYIIEDFKNVVAESDEGLMRVAKIVADLKNFAHAEADETEWVDLNAGIESTLNIVWNELKYKAEVTRHLGALPLVRCYPQRINQVIMNILLNAGQAIEDKGRISIKTSAANGHVTIAVSDDGQGIQPEHLNKIFDPFFTTKQVGKGTGLGLNVVYNIVKSHKGSIDVDSRLGQGTTFTIRFPIEPEFDAPPQVQAPHEREKIGGD